MAIMRVLCGLSLEDSKLLFSFIMVRKGKLVPYLSSESNVSYSHHNLEEFIQENIDTISESISAKEQKYSFKTERFFFKLPREYASKKAISNVVSLNIYKRKKRITQKDIAFVRKQVENISLDWQDVCLHQLVSEYFIGKDTFHYPPIGMKASKLGLKSLIIFVPARLHNTFVDTFNNVGRKFSGFIYETRSEEHTSELQSH